MCGQRDPPGAMFESTPHINSSIRLLRLFLVPLVAALVAAALTVTPSPASSTGIQLPRQAVHPRASRPRQLRRPAHALQRSSHHRGRAAPAAAASSSTSASTSRRPTGRRSTRSSPARSSTVSTQQRLGQRLLRRRAVVRVLAHQPAVRVGDHVTAYETVLGRILRDTRARPPHRAPRTAGRSTRLQAGHLTPYTDKAAPRIRSISVAEVRSGRSSSRTSSAARSTSSSRPTTRRTARSRASGATCPWRRPASPGASRR